jgi:AmmeMemoRadiSam system protein B/AmmeMemoRadiSam system protein A
MVAGGVMTMICGRRSPVAAWASLLAAVLVVLTASAPAAVAAVRAPAVAGRFYPEEPAALRSAVKEYLRDARPAAPDRPVVLVAPHAGYVFSGQIAADAWNQAAGGAYDLIVILGANHTTAGFAGVSVYTGEGYRTPLGVVQCDRELSRRLCDADPAFTFREEVHAREHSVEVQLPFVQLLFPDTPIVAAVVGGPDPELCAKFGRAVATAAAGRSVLVVASTDLSHYPAYDDAVAADGALLRALAAGEVRQAAYNLRGVIAREESRGRPGLSTCACGEAPLLAALAAAPLLGGLRTVVVSYANSGDTALGDRDRVVGYGAVAITRGVAPNDTAALARPQPAPGDRLGPADRDALLALARATIEQYLDSQTAPLARGCGPAAWRKQGAFVTLQADGALRGCIGHMAEDRPLCQVVGAMALQAAFNDRRFAPLRAEELPGITIEISVLTPYAPVASADEVRIGTDGVMLRKEGRSAVFLPQVAVEQGWSRSEMLDQLCRKAGLAAGAWRQGAELWTFQAEIFAESGHR